MFIGNDKEPTYLTLIDIKRYRYDPSRDEEDQHQFEVVTYPRINKADSWASIVDFNTSFDTMRRLSLFVKENLRQNKRMVMHLISGSSDKQS